MTQSWNGGEAFVSMIDPNIRLRICRVGHGRDLPLPAYKTHGAAGVDLAAAIEESYITIPPGGRGLLGLGVIVEIPYGYFGMLTLRSSLGLKGFSMPHGVGIIDSDFRGELALVIANMNFGDVPLVIHRGDRVAQLIVMPVLQVPIVEIGAGEITSTARGSGGFGSTGQ